VVITFDDGYLDNWVHAFPILRRYGHRATIFVSTDFVHPGSDVRPTVDDVWAGVTEACALELTGYLSWEEMRRMEQSGLVEIESHGVTHTRLFCTDRVIDFRHEGDGYYWIDWNTDRQSKPFWLHRQDCNRASHGDPVYESGEALLVREYHPDASVAENIRTIVAEQGVEHFYSNPRWRERLSEKLKELQASSKGGRFEGAREYRERVLKELCESKRTIETMLGKKVEFFCWPADKFTQESLDLAFEFAGYRACTGGRGHNQAGVARRVIARVFVGSHFMRYFGRRLDLVWFKAKVEQMRGNYFAYLIVAPMTFFKKTMDLVAVRHRPGRDRI
jgi:hypothetical protein